MLVLDLSSSPQSTTMTPPSRCYCCCFSSLLLPWAVAIVIAWPAPLAPCHGFPLPGPSFVPTRTSTCTSTSASSSYCLVPALPVLVGLPTKIPTSRRISERRYGEAGLEHTITADRRRTKCGYFFEGRWEQRKDLADLKIGDKLLGRKLDGCDLLEAKTGPKIFFECGVGRIDASGKWQMVNGMLRLGRRGARKSTTKKRANRMTDKIVDLYVSRIDTSAGRLEVTTSQEQAKDAVASGDNSNKVPASSLKEGDILVGTVVKVEDYGVFVDVGANRLGLMHIQRVADLFDRYIKKAEGLVDSGLERGAKIRVSVVSNEKKRLFLDFTPDVIEEAEAERKEKQRRREEGKESAAAKQEAGAETVKSQQEDAAEESVDISEDEDMAWAAYGIEDDDAADWAAFAAANDDAYDEDDDIEDALGIGTYR